jgi:Fe-S-cluster containining protein
MAEVAEILARYRELCDYCQVLARRVEARFGPAWQCRAGCGGCCRLETVCGLEAAVLLAGGAGYASAPSDVEDGVCCLLLDERCQFYGQRPLICRTHGLPLASAELTDGEVDCCPLNLPALAASDELEADLVLDLDLVTENLLRLNLALFLLLGRPEMAEMRFPLTALAGGGKGLPPELLAAAREMVPEDER